MIRGALCLAVLALLDSSGVREALDPLRCHLVRSSRAGDEYAFAVSVSRAAGLAAAGRRDGAVQLWNAKTWEPLRKFEAHEGYCYAAVFSPDGKALATAGLDGTVKLWNPESGTLRHTFRAGQEAVLSLAFASGGARLVAAQGTAVRLWGVREGTSAELGAHPQEVSAVAASGDRAASAGLDGSVKLWDLPGRREIRTLPGHAGCAYAVAFQPGGALVASGGSDKMIRLWSSATGEKVRTLEGHSGAIHSVAFASAGRHLLSAGGDGVHVWDVASGRLLRSLGPAGLPAYGVAVAPAGGEIVSVGSDNQLRVWAPQGERLSAEEVGRENGFLGVSYVDGGGALINSVIDDTQAQKAGFRAGDVITGVNDVPVEKSEDFLNFMRQSREGDEVNVRLRREGASKLIRVKLGKWN